MSSDTEYKIQDGVSVEDWIGGVSYLQAEHTIHRNPALVAKYQPLMDKISALEAERERLLGPRTISRTEEESLDASKEEPAALEESLGEGNALVSEIHEALKALYAEAEALWEEYSSDVEVWVLRRLDENEAAEILEEVGGLPKAPKSPAKGASPSEKKKYAGLFQEWSETVQARNRDLNYACLAKAVVKVTVRGKEVPAPDSDALKRLSTRPGGQRHIRDLISVMETLSGEGPEITAPHRKRA